MVAPLEDGDGHGLAQETRDRRQVAIGELLLEVDRVRRNHRPLAGSRRPERQWCQVRE